MELLSIIGVGLAFVVLGLLFWLMTRFLLRTSARIRPIPGLVGEPLYQDREAVITIEPGGRVLALDQTARALFHLGETDLPNLERLARQMRPSEPFLALCAAPGEGTFVIDGKTYAAESHLLPVPGQTLIAVTLRQSDVSTLSAEGGTAGTQTLSTITELTQAMAASLELEATISAILDSVGKIIPADYLEITLWDADSEWLIPYRRIGAAGGERRVEASPDRYRIGQGYSGYIARERTHLLVEDTNERTDIRPTINRNTYPIRSYLGVPLMLGKEFIGTLELGSLSPGTFKNEDLEFLRLLSGQAAIAVHNATLYREERRRSRELSGLAQLSQAMSLVRESGSIFERLVDSIIPLVPVDILGFLLYNENTRMLEGRPPFHGLPEPFIQAMYRVEIRAGSPLEQSFLEQDIVMSENASEDERWKTLGLDSMAVAAGLRDTVLVPLTSSGRMIGYLQASNHSDGTTIFSQDELRLLLIIANQAASIIENAVLVQQSRQRAQRAEALRRIASLASSAANLDEILKFSIQELVRLVEAESGFLFLVNEGSGDLALHVPSLHLGEGQINDSAASLPLSDPQFPFTVAGSLHTLNVASVDEEPAIIPFYLNTLRQLGAHSFITVPLSVRERGVGELWLTASRIRAFDQGDLQAAVTAAGQLAGVVEQNVLAAQTDESLRRRVDQLTSLSRISRELSTLLDINRLIQVIHDDAVQITGADCGSTLLFDLSRPADSAPIVRLFFGDTPLDSLTALEMDVLGSGEIANLPDAGAYEMAHEGVQSALLIPIMVRDRPAGLMVLHSRRPAAFDQTAVEVSQSLASQAAIALSNALLFEEQTRRGEILKRQLEVASNLFHTTQALHFGAPLEETLSNVAQGIREATRFSVVLFSVIEPGTSSLRRIAGVGLSPEAWNELSAHTQTWAAVEPLLQPEFKTGGVYYIPADKTPAISETLHTLTVLSDSSEPSPDRWHPDDFLLVPLMASNGDPIGLISLDAPSDGRRPDVTTLEALNLFAAQAAMIVESHFRLSEMEAQLRVQPQVVSSGRTGILQMGMSRLQAGMEIAEAAARQTSPEAMLRELAREVMNRFGMQAAILAEKNAAGLRLLETHGAVPPSVHPDSLFGQRNPLRQTLLEGKVLVSADLSSDPTWKDSPLLNAFAAQSFLTLPLQVTADSGRALLVIGQQSQLAFSEEDQRALARLSRQVSLSLQNLALLSETRRHLTEVDLLLQFSRRLGSLDPDEILASLASSALEVIGGAEAAWVGLLDDSGRLIPRAARGYKDHLSLLEIVFTPGEDPDREVFPLRPLRQSAPVRLTELDFARDYALPSDDLMRYRAAVGGRLPVSSLAVPILLPDQALGVVVLDNFSTPAAFSEEDVALLESLTQQSALGLENARLFRAVGQRAGQLQALTQVGASLTSRLQSAELLGDLLPLLKTVLDYDTATLWLRDEDRLYISAASGFTDEQSRLGITVQVEDSLLFQQMTATRTAILVPDVRADERFPSLVEPEYLSWMGVPLVAKDELIGLIALEKKPVGAYSTEDVQAATTFASQAAVALENARLFEESNQRAAELNQRSERLALLNRLSGELGASLDVDYILRLTAQQLVQALGVDRAAAILVDDQGRFQIQVVEPADREEKLPRLLPDLPWLRHLRETQGIFSTDNLAGERSASALIPHLMRGDAVSSLLAVPVVSGANFHGWFLLMMSEIYRFSEQEIELARTICNQAGIAIQNGRLFAETHRLTTDLERRVEERTEELTREHRNSQTLLRIITELSTSLDLDQVLHRALKVLVESTGAGQAAILLAQSPNIYQTGTPLADFSKGKTGLENDIHRWVMKHREPALIDDIGQDARWKVDPDSMPAYRSAACVPLIVGEDVLGTLLLLHPETSFFLLEQIDLFEASARQIAISLNNAELFGLIRDQAERLGGMLREQQIEASRSRAILEAVADGVLVTDSQNKITLFNKSAETILDLKADRVMNRPIEDFIGLFGKASRTWAQTISTWSQDPTAYQSVEPFSEQVDLDNQKVVSVHLAPVYWRNQFLGTVSTFRDITHEVQVDRLKSEFVANVSHELRTPMTSIKGYTEILLMGAAGEVGEQQRHFLEIIKENTERLSALVNDLLDIARMETGRVRLNIQPVQLDELAQEVFQDIQRRAQEENKNIDIQLDITGSIPEIAGDRERIRQVLGNLLSNGYNYTPDGGKVILHIQPVEKGVQVDVEDNGIGIHPSVHHRIFDRFYRGEDPLVLATAGFGLGLALSRSIVEMHGGQIWFKSTGIPGEGSVFSFMLPAVQPEEEK